MRILISGHTGECMPPPYGGTQNVSLLYARAYKALGHQTAVSFAYRPENADDIGANADYFYEYSGKPTKLTKLAFLARYFFTNPLLYFTLLSRYLRACPRLSVEAILYSAYGVWADGMIRQWKPDIIACQTALIKTFMVAEVAKRHGVPVVFEPYAEIHDQNMGVNKHLSAAEQKKYWTYFLSMSALTIGMDNCSIGPQMYLPTEKVKTFYDTCDWQSYQVIFPESRDDLRDAFELPQDLMLFCMMGAFHYRKGHDQLIRAVGILKHAHPDVRVGAVIIGGNAGLQKWRDLAKEENVVDRVFFFQNFNEDKKMRMYACADGYCNLSNSTRSCGLDLALLEAMSCGLPVVVYDNGALPHAVPDDENGLIVPTGDISKLAEALLSLYNTSVEKRKAMSEKSREVASKTDVRLTSKIKLEWFEKIIHDETHILGTNRTF
jgi:glycosyltransferase involved in cell wall biosynthesis